MDEIASRIFELASKKGLSNKDLAALLNTTDKKVSAWRTGRAKTYRDYYDQLAEILDTTVEYLRNGFEPDPVAKALFSREDEAMLRKIHDSPDLRVMFSLTSKASPEDVKKALDIIRIVLNKPEDLP